MRKLLFVFHVVVALSLTYTIQHRDMEMIKLKKENKVLQQQYLSNLQIQQKQYQKIVLDYEILKNKRVLTPQDINALEKIVEAEARGEPKIGKVAVANVVINRLLQDKETSVHKVVTKRNQFEPVSRGSYQRSRPSKETREAVVLATYKDYTNGATHFMNPKISDKDSVKWFRKKLTLTVKIGNHQFYK